MTLLGLDLGPHWAFIVTAYALALATVLGLIAWVILDHRRQLKMLDDLDKRGLRRRSGRSSA